MKRVSVLISLLISVSAYSQAKVDTLYYNKSGRIARNPVFVEYYRIVLSEADSAGYREFRDFYDTGELRREGFLETLDSLDDGRTVFAGEVTSYHRNGAVSETAHYLNGRLEGACLRFGEDGSLKAHIDYSEGRISGNCVTCYEDGSRRVEEYREGDLLHDYYLFCDAEGNESKYRIADDSPVRESPAVSERRIDYCDGVPWEVYSKNGITIALTCSIVRDYGRWHRIDLAVSNNSRVPVVFTPETDIVAYSTDDRGGAADLGVWPCDEYMKRVKRGQTWAAIGMSLSAGISSTSTSTTTGYTSKGVHFTATTSTYDAAEARRQCEEFDRRLQDEKHRKQSGYLKKNTIYPSESVYGFVHVERVKGRRVVFVVKMEDAEYIYEWEFDKNAAYPVNNRQL